MIPRETLAHQRRARKWMPHIKVTGLQWRQVDFKAGEVRLDPGTTKNDDGRVFPFTVELRELLETQHAEHEKLKKAGIVEPWVFWQMVGTRGTRRERQQTSRSQPKRATLMQGADV